MSETALQFTNTWADRNIPVLNQLFDAYKPKMILEVGSFEGRLTTWMMNKLGDSGRGGEIHCIDTWAGGVEHREVDMSAVERRFLGNIDLTQKTRDVLVKTHKGTSLMKLCELISGGFSSQFDLVYIDGSHQSTDVISDACLGFNLCKVGGLLVFDDYLWGQNNCELSTVPKLAIDSFVNIFSRKLQVLEAPLYQLYCLKLQSV